VDVDDVGGRERVQVGVFGGPRIEALDAPHGARRRRPVVHPADREAYVVPRAHLGFQHGQQVLVGAAALAEPVAQMEDAHPRHDAMRGGPPTGPIIRACPKASRHGPRPR
jgi:hypothetical protein